MKNFILLSALCATMTLSAQEAELHHHEDVSLHTDTTPDINLIIDSSFVQRSVKDDEASHLEIPDVAHALLGSHSDGEHSHASYNANNGFNINYAELIISSSIDEHIKIDSVIHFTEFGVAIDEAYFTTFFAHELRLRGGKFLSNFGYINAQHHHAWDFADMPLVYESFLGMHKINEKGLQLQWRPFSSSHIMVGAEVLQGENIYMFGNTSIGSEQNYIENSVDAPSLFVSYIKTSIDFYKTKIKAGLSYASGSTRLDYTNSDEEPYAFGGNSKLYGADLVLSQHLSSHSYITWQSEWLSREMDGTYHEINPTDANLALSSTKLNKTQSGIYSQLIYTYNDRYKFGVRYDNIYQNDITKDKIEQDTLNNFEKYSVMIEYRTSPLAKFRLQYNKNYALYNEDGEKQDINTIILQANISIGSHKHY